MNNKNLVVIPTYNEVENIDELFAAIFKHVPDIHVLIIDDASKDGTADLVKSYQKKYLESIHMIEREGKLGLGTAYICGFKWALEKGYKTITEMDADLSHDPAILKTIISTLETSDVVIGSRYVEGGGTVNWGLIRKFISRFGSLYARTILGLKIRDLTGGFNGWNRKVLETIDLNAVKSEGYSFQIELKYRASNHGFNIKEIPILFADRRAGQSKMSSNIVLEAMTRVWALRLRR